MDTFAIVSLIYGVGIIVSLVPTMRAIRRSEILGPNDGSNGDLFELILVTFSAVWFWPLFLPGYWLWSVAKMDAQEDKDKAR